MQHLISFSAVSVDIVCQACTFKPVVVIKMIKHVHLLDYQEV